MKRLIMIIGVVFVMITSVNAQIDGIITWVENIDFTFRPEGEYMDVVSEPSTYLNEIGAPNLPYCVKTFLVPVGVQPSVQIHSVNKELLKSDILVYPAQPQVIISSVPEWVEPDSRIYNSSDPYPGSYAEIISDREDFGYHLVTVKFSPLEYVPNMRKLYLCDISFSLTYSSTSPSSASQFSVNSQSGYLNELDKEYIRSIIDNKEALDGVVPDIKSIVPKTYSDNPVLRSATTAAISEVLPEYLIITNNELKKTFQELADWKIKKGIPTIIETVENIAVSQAGSDLQEKIRNYLIYIKKSYGSLFVLLGGDTNIIPARLKEPRAEKSNVAVDFYYACVNGGNWNRNGNNLYFEDNDYTSSDWGLTFKLGRASVENKTEAETFVEKAIHYEKADLNINYSYFNNSVAASAFISKSDNGYLYNDGRDSIARYYQKYAGTLNRWLIYDHYNCESNTSSCNGKHSKYTDNTHKGEELNKSNFISALQNGGNSGLDHFHLIYHMDHSSPTGMGTSSKDKNEAIHNNDVDNLENGNYYPILMSGGCLSADITKDCIAEHFLNKTPGGAVAFIGNTDAGYASEYRQLKGLLGELYKTSPNHTNRYDLSILYAKALMYKTVEKNNCALHLFGDPEMQVWTSAPKTLSASVSPTSLSTGQKTITIAVSGLPQNETARVCIRKADELYIVDNIGNGQHTIDVLTQTAGTIDVTLTAHNYRPVERSIQVSGIGSQPALAISDLVYNDNTGGNVIGNGDGQLDAGETIGLTVKLKNTGAAMVTAITGTLSSQSSDVQILTAHAVFGTVVGNGVTTSTTPFVFRINKDSEQHLKNSEKAVTLRLQITVNGSSRVELFKLEDIHVPEIQIGNQIVTWTSNGNTRVEAGETVRMNIDLTNIGNAEATGLKAMLTTKSQQVSCPSTLVTYPNISSFETKANTTTLSFQTLSTYMGQLDLNLMVTNAYGKTWNFPVNPLSRPNTINTATMNFQPYESSINVYWTPVKNIAGYNIYRSNNGEYGTYRKLNKFLLTAAYFLDENLAGCTAYHYKVTAVSTNGNESGLSTAYKAWTSYPAVSPFPQRLPINYSSESAPTVADVDNDGKQEIFWLCDNRNDLKDSYIMGFRANGEELYDIDNNVTTVSGFARTPVMVREQAAIGDLKGNGEQSIIVSSWDDEANAKSKHTVFCYSAFDKDGDKRPDLLWETKIPFSMHQRPVIANLDGSADGTMEVLVKSHHTPDIYMLDCNGQEIRRLNPNVATDKNRNYSDLAVADLDNDGKMEIIASYDSLGIYIWRQDGRPFKTNPFWGKNIEKLGSAPVICDLNEDGKKDILFSQRKIATSHVYAIDRNGNSIPGWNGSQTIPYTVGGSLDHTLSVGDINNDGHLEVVILGRDMIKVWKHTGALLWQKEIKGLFQDGPYAGNVNTPILADVDGDAIPDIVFCSGKLIYALHNDGSDIVGFPIISDQEFKDTPCVSDIDNDGKNELIAGDEYSLYVWKTNGVPGAIEWGLKRGNSRNTGEYASGICEPMVVNGNQTWDGETPCANVVIQSGKFVIPAGKTMMLSKASAVIVRPGATLEVNGGTISGATVKALAGSKVIIRNNGKILLGNKSGLEIEKGATLDYQYGNVDIAN